MWVGGGVWAFVWEGDGAGLQRGGMDVFGGDFFVWVLYLGLIVLYLDCMFSSAAANLYL